MSTMKSFIESLFSTEKPEPIGFQSLEDLPSHEDVIPEPTDIINNDKEEDTIGENSVSSENTLAEEIEESEIRPSTPLPVPVPVPVTSELKEKVSDTEPIMIKPNRCLSNCNIM